MKNEYSANLALQTKHTGKPLIAKKQRKYATIQALLTSWLVKFSVTLAALLVVKQIFF